MLQEELEATNREVMLLTLELEQRVAERTAELAHSNQQLLKEVADRIRAEAQVKELNKDLARRAELLKAANEELEAFSSSVSHDLRNPLARVMGFATLLTDAAGPTLDQKNREYLEKISAAATQMAALIDDLLRLSHASQAELTWARVDLNQLLETVIAELEQEAKGRRIIWKRAPLPVVLGDASLLKQVFLNLVSNALKYTRPRDPAEIEIASLDRASEEHVFVVRDNGVGFDPQHATKLFGAFQRLHCQQEFEGTGIGLLNVRRIVLRHGGRVWAEGQIGQGASFYFSLPRRKLTDS
jgi:light-regulated signal transduction histidine kinase (bacteriophytochrome)